MRLCCVCTGNTCRSPMLAALLRRALGERAAQHEILSAGIAAGAGQPASPHAVACMAARGIDLGNHRSSPLSRELLSGCDRFVCLGPRHAAALQQLGVKADRIVIVGGEAGVPDPFGGDRAVYEDCARVLEEADASLARQL